MRKPCKIPAWQIEREQILTRAVRSFEFRIGRGEKRCRASRRVARRYHGRPFKCDKVHKMALSPVTLRRFHMAWKRAGESASVFRLKYYSRRSVISAAQVVDFIRFCLTDNSPSLKRAWETFPRRGNISYSKLRYMFPANNFYLIRERMNAVMNATQGLSELTQALITETQQRLPEPTTNQNK